MATAATDFPASAVSEPAPSSILQTLNRINTRLDCLLSELPTRGNADLELRLIAHDVVATLARDPDIALACIFLNQIDGRYAVRHCLETALVACLVGGATGSSAAELLTVAAASLSMNAGMMPQMDGFLSRAGPLTSAERAEVLRHPAESAALLRCAGVTDEEWIDCVLLHHERDDGSGYPQGRRADRIPRNARLIGMADRYCACVSTRNYRRSMLPPVALRAICSEHGHGTDAELAPHFLAQLGYYPPGTRVRLASGEIGVVSRRCDAENSQVVHALRAASGELLERPEPRRTGPLQHAIEEALHEDQVPIRFSMKHIWGELASL